MSTSKLRAKIKQRSKRHYTQKERALFVSAFKQLEADAGLSEMKKYIQHGHTSVSNTHMPLPPILLV